MDNDQPTPPEERIPDDPIEAMKAFVYAQPAHDVDIDALREKAATEVNATHGQGDTRRFLLPPGEGGAQRRMSVRKRA